MGNFNLYSMFKIVLFLEVLLSLVMIMLFNVKVLWKILVCVSLEFFCVLFKIRNL